MAFISMGNQCNIASWENQACCIKTTHSRASVPGHAAGATSNEHASSAILRGELDGLGSRGSQDGADCCTEGGCIKRDETDKIREQASLTCGSKAKDRSAVD